MVAVNKLNIRPAIPEDAETILQFIKDLAQYEKLEHEVKADVASITQSLFAEGATAHAIICELDGEAVGYGVYFYNYSTWLAKNGLYLEDLYVAPPYRKIGAGKAILKYLAQQAVAENCGRFEWCVLDWNQPAIDFYQSIGAEPQDEWILYRLTGQALEHFAK
ncbi:GCN5 family N-acetyltransferase [Agarivorans gilvus]|uniref:GCN5 family N-acetyltransferase n=1 Tax=Agarivorans gilvus TaxID=680279 RepID=A0ABQ1I5D5_9ALTE|nr:GNAT family N-acetyltransferase [Agarivorans gilvus]GGB14698.1 GCN5 family N-acetyltransferase [Agarivorans gilvus]